MDDLGRADRYGELYAREAWAAHQIKLHADRLLAFRVRFGRWGAEGGRQRWADLVREAAAHESAARVLSIVAATLRGLEGRGRNVG